MKHKIHLLLLIVLMGFGCGNTETPNLEDEIKSIETGLIRSILVKGEPVEKYSIEERMEYHKVPGVSIAIVRNGEIRWAKGYGIANTTNGTRVNPNTLFQAGSISKPLAALAVLKLREENKVGLDENVNDYLKGWKIADNQFTANEKVTLRRLLTHTAGTTVHGFPGYLPSDTLPSIIQVLNGDGNTPRVFVDTIPGSIWRYSGGGYEIMEKVVEDVSGLSLDRYMQDNILGPLQMNHSTYEQPLPKKYHENASSAYDSKGELIEGNWHNYPEQAAAGLWTTPTDLAKYCIEIQGILSGNSTGILSKKMIEMMLTKHKNNWGLGPSLAGSRSYLRFQHGGKNAGFTNNLIGFAYTGDAVIIMTNADNGGKIIGELLRSVSDYYDWGISEPRTVKLADIGKDVLDKYTGRYLLQEKVPGIGDYFIEIIREDKKLVVIDPNNNERDELWALDTLKFIDLDDGDEMIFRLNADSAGFTWNNRFQFDKVN